MRIERVDINRPSMTLAQFAEMHNLTVVVTRDFASPVSYRYVAAIKGYRVDSFTGSLPALSASASEAEALERLAKRISLQTLVAPTNLHRISVPLLITKGFIW